tara:strand:+ start:217 stop:525 length:309 start_codon:yes stop_codon:yes gene_type:complete
MNKTKFISMFESIRDDVLGTDRNSTTDNDDAYDTFLDLTKQITEKGDTALLMMERMSSMTSKERLRWRMCLAENGIEMTPSQVDEYIILLELALSFSMDEEA